MSTDKVECGVCGAEFDSTHSLGSHKAAGHGKPWMDEGNLREGYVNQGKTSYELADDWGCDSKTVRNWLDKFGIERRQTGEWQRQEFVSLWHTEQGYVYWKDYTPPSRGDSFPVHRLLAIAEHGPEAVKDKHVHHKNGVPWDNRIENLELVGASEHIKLHQEKGEIPTGPEAQDMGGYDPRGLFVGLTNEERYKGMYEELKSEAKADMEASD